jgi:hypothetical protein
MILPDDKTVNLEQFNQELESLGLPGFTGAARLARRDGATVPLYILVKSASLSSQQEAAVEQVWANHNAQPPTVPRLEQLRQKPELTAAEKDEILMLLLGR